MRPKDSQGSRCNTDAGASPLFPPVHLDQETAAAEVQAIVYRSPRLYELPQSRWSYQGLRQVCPWLRPLTDAGICQVLGRLEVCYKRGRVYVHSPDPQYVHKLVRIVRAYREALAHPERIIFLFEDEHTFCRNPTQASCYAGVGTAAHQARLYAGYDSTRRIAGCLNPVSGELITLQRNHFPAEIFTRFLAFVEAQYPQAETIYIALDNWPVHCDDLVLTSLEARQSRIRLLPLPTYAPWTNPIEKVWRKFNQEVAHMHPFSSNWKGLRQTVDAWFEQWREGSQDLLKYVGLAQGYNPLKAVSPYP